MQMTPKKASIFHTLTSHDDMTDGSSSSERVLFAVKGTTLENVVKAKPRDMLKECHKFVDVQRR